MNNAIDMNPGTGKYQVEFLRINTKDLTVHPIAQRAFDQEHGDKLARNFDWNKYDPISVSYRNGRYLIIRGQHRVYAIKKRNGGKDCTILCRVLYGMTLLDEVEYFLEGKGYVEKRIGPNDRYKVLNAIGDETISGMVRGAELAGWTVDFETAQKDGRIIAVVALKNCYEALNFSQYVTMLKTINAAWDGDKFSVNQLLLKGFAVFFQHYAGQFEPKELAKKLQGTTPKKLLAEGKTYESNRDGSRGIRSGVPFARAILKRYNHNRRNHTLKDDL